MRWLQVMAAIGIVALCAGCDAGTSVPPIAKRGPEDVRLWELLNIPGHYNGRLVRVTGMCHVAVERHALSLPQDDERSGYIHEVWLTFGELADRVKGLDGKLVVVEGRFHGGDPRGYGHEGVFRADIDQITRVEELPRAATP
jgi:hypothetical protein